MLSQTPPQPSHGKFFEVNIIPTNYSRRSGDPQNNTYFNERPISFRCTQHRQVFADTVSQQVGNAKALAAHASMDNFLAAVCLCQRSFQVARSPSVHHETTAQQRMVTFVPLYYLRVPSPANPSRTSQAERPWRRPRGRGRFSTGQSNSGVGGRAYVTRGICSCDDWRAGTTSASFKYLKSLLDSTRVYLSLLPGVWPNNVLGCWGTNSRQSAGLWGAAMKLRAAKESWGPTVS